MKICIVTVYNSLNCGSFLQAFTLMKTFQYNNNEVSFLETKARKPLYSSLKSSIKLIFTGKLKGLIYIWRKFIRFRKLFPEFLICKMERQSIDKQDIFILGSDEIWNVGRKEFSKFPVFWGSGLDDKKIISYAPSINRATLQTIKKLEYPEKSLAKLKAIAVRDTYTKSVLENLTDTNIKLVLDPTLLYDDTFYANFESPINENNYILVYAHQNRLRKRQIESIKKFAQNQQLPLISINFQSSWCDKSIPVSPFEFLSYFRHASYVVTNTYHGTLFSVIYKKQFITFADDNIKILDFLNMLGLHSRNDIEDNDINNIINTYVDYDSSYHILENLKKESLEYLRKAMN